ncbi:MAG: hypothetical protein N2Z69_00570 [Methylophilaceae bacterium]|nr:hypothetical protein [Methylophilaceae bacterium]
MITQPRLILAVALLSLGTSVQAPAAVLAEAEEHLKIVLAKPPTSRPMSIAYVPDYKRYYVADGGFGATLDATGGLIPSKSEIHVYSERGDYLQSMRLGLDNRSLYFNRNTQRLESITFNVSSFAGFTPYCGIFGLKLNEQGDLLPETQDILNFNPAFGDASTGPSYDPVDNRYLAKQPRSNKVWVVKTDKREKIAEIELDLDAAGVQPDAISDYFVAWTGIAGEELAILDIDHKAILVFDARGKFVGRSQLPADIKLRAQNHYNGSGYANGLFFVYSETEGPYGTLRSFRISDQAPRPSQLR